VFAVFGGVSNSQSLRWHCGVRHTVTFPMSGLNIPVSTFFSNIHNPS